MMAREQNDGEFSDSFEVTNGVKQGCVMAPTLLSMIFSTLLMDAFQDSDTGFPIRYRFGGNIFNLRRLQAKTKVHTDVLDELLYVYDIFSPIMMMRSLPELQKQVWHSENCIQMSGSEMESSLTPS